MNVIRPIMGPSALIKNQLNNGNDQKSESGSFMDRLKVAMNDVNDRQIGADEASEKVVKGKLGIQEGMMSIQEADVSLRYMLQVRGKALDAYREVMRMQF